MQPTLVILAAGMGSRYGGLKQMDGLGPANETIIDFSVYDAIRAGFGKVVFVIRNSFLEDFKERVSVKFADQIKVEFAFQDLEPEIPGLGKVARIKPWGTAHAVLMAKNFVDSPFAVINADDYYGVNSFNKMADFLTNSVQPDIYAMVGFRLSNTISRNGSVSRGICEMDGHHFLTEVVERTKIYQVNNQILYVEKDRSYTLNADDLVSMNFWGFHPAFFDQLEKAFFEFAKKNHGNPKSEFYIPLIVSQMIEDNQARVKVLESTDQWYGVTYAEDKPKVQQAFQHLIENGVYNSPLWKN